VDKKTSTEVAYPYVVVQESEDNGIAGVFGPFAGYLEAIPFKDACMVAKPFSKTGYRFTIMPLSSQMEEDPSD
jgi:hypothetical protein